MTIWTRAFIAALQGAAINDSSPEYTVTKACQVADLAAAVAQDAPRRKAAVAALIAERKARLAKRRES